MRSSVVRIAGHPQRMGDHAGRTERDPSIIAGFDHSDRPGSATTGDGTTSASTTETEHDPALIMALRYARPTRSTGVLRRLIHWLTVYLAILNWRILNYCDGNSDSSTKLSYIISALLAKTPFEAKIISKHYATWNTCDFMLHMSNSAYAIALDEARAIWQIQMIGAAMRADHEKVRPMIASTHFTYFSEIPILADFQLYLLARFTTDPPKGSQTRTLNCLSITRMVNKIGRRTVRPEKLMALSGLGQEPKEWEQISQLRQVQVDKSSSTTQSSSKLDPAQQWLVSPEPLDSFLKFEDRRVHNLEIIRAALDGDLKIGAERLKDL
ncbi:hypothetical protein H4Q26_000805 [Puccinia striiformis f. sp. tritici PST-130]|nr:hypothetical protein H4Q26_000805 [Puccinia striiformis f. sp. tritici PST-130]